MLRAFCLFLLMAPAFALQNQMAEHPSPYLAMHADDPVAWQDWNAEVLEKARTEDKLVLVSSGYFSCHWCHVMQRESFQNPKIAALLNAHFIPVKLDRELHPALDQYLIDFLEQTQGRSGWPLNIFLTPEGYPLLGATYVEPERFELVLQRMQATWANERSQTRNLARRTLLQLTANRNASAQATQSVAELRDSYLQQIMMVGDPMEGGFGNQSKFPMAPQLLTALALRGDKPAPPLDMLLQTSLDQMAIQGLRDHLEGGFFRYTVDPSWQVPHFEKMLYTQAHLARIYAQAGTLYQRSDYHGIAQETLDFTLRKMIGENGLLISSFSAIDEQGEEGGPYLWQHEELFTLLGDADAQLALQHWAMAGAPALDAGHLPRQGMLAAEIAQANTGEGALDEAAIEARLSAIRMRLREARAQRVLPADGKELAGWNGLMLGAFAEAAKHLEQPRYQLVADALARGIRDRLWRDGELWRARSGDQPVGASSLADYAYVAEGVDLLLQQQPDAELAAWRDQLIEQAWQRFHGVGGWHAGAGVRIPGMGEKAALKDTALRSPSAIIMDLTLRGENAQLKARARELLKATALPIEQEPFFFPSHLLVLYTHES